MQYKNTIEAIYIHLDEIQQLVARFGADDDVRTIDVDLTLDKIRDVYDLLLSVRSESKDDKTILRTIHKEVHAEEGPIESKQPEPEPEQTIELEVEEPMELEAEEEIVEEKPEKPVQKKEATQAEKHSRVKPIQEKKNLGESFSQETPTLNEELSQNPSGNDISSRLKTKPISSLSAAIGLNEKFELIQNLFDGDTDRYNHTLDVLNMATNFNEAFEYINSNFNWDMNDPLVIRILELIRRKLIVKKNEQ